MKEELGEVKKLNLCCFWLIKTCRDTNAEEMVVTQKNVSFEGENTGDWEITVKKVSPLKG